MKLLNRKADPGLVTLIFIGIFLFFSILYRLPQGSFLFIHDEYLLVSPNEAKYAFVIRNPNDLGFSNFTITLVTIFDRLYYFLAYKMSSDVHLVTRSLLLLKILISLIFPYLGIKMLSKVSGNTSWVLPVILSVFYAFNSYATVYWHGNGFSLTLLLCYSLAPLALALLDRIYFDAKKDDPSSSSKLYLEYILCVISLFVMGFSIYLVLVFAILYLIYFSLRIYTEKINLLEILKKSLIILTLLLPLMALPSLFLYDMFLSGVQNVNFSGGETYNLIRGGFLYPLLLWFSWGIYTVWEPRSIFTFHEFYSSLFYLIPILINYAVIIYLSYKYTSNKKVYFFIFTFLVMLFFVKGPQLPFGDIYLFLIEKVPLFRVFRSPDNKFGFGVVFSLFMLMYFVYSYLGRLQIRIKLLLYLVLILFVVTQIYIFASGKALIGESSSTSSDRIVAIPENYQRLSEFLNSQEYSYYVTIPDVNFGYYRLGDHDKHFGQDILAKLINRPFVSLNEHTSMSRESYTTLKKAFAEFDRLTLNTFPIRYYIIRTDNIQSRPNPRLVEFITQAFTKVFEVKDFVIYENTRALSYLSSTDNLSSQWISPARILLSGNINSGSQIVLGENYSKDWVLTDKFGNQVPAKHHTDYFLNKWTVESPLSNELTINYRPQYYFTNILAFTFAYLIFLVLLGVVAYIKRDKVSIT